jgi:hypothetical protein
VTDDLDLADAELLVAAEVLAPDGDGFRLLRDDREDVGVQVVLRGRRPPL